MDEDFLKLFDKYTIQKIDEGELYMLVKGDLVVHLSHFSRECDMPDLDNNEAIVTAFRDHLNILTLGGSLGGIIAEVKKILK